MCCRLHTFPWTCVRLIFTSNAAASSVGRDSQLGGAWSPARHMARAPRLPLLPRSDRARGSLVALHGQFHRPGLDVPLSKHQRPSSHHGPQPLHLHSSHLGCCAEAILSQTIGVNSMNRWYATSATTTPADPTRPRRGFDNMCVHCPQIESAGTCDYFRRTTPQPHGDPRTERGTLRPTMLRRDQKSAMRHHPMRAPDENFPTNSLSFRGIHRG